MKDKDLVKDIVKALRSDVYEYRGHLPWRKTRDAYKILVSEMMLQQTQVDRVMPFYGSFLKRFPTVNALAQAPLSDVLRAWQGLGYNRRGKYLHDAARAIVKDYGGKVPRNAELLEKLPGIGHYTARAIAAFAFNSPEVFVETNIRTVIFHHSLRGLPSGKTVDSELLVVVEEVLMRSQMQPREFYARLMDYGTFLKKSGVRLNHRSAHYAKQKKFEGSTRQLRAAILRELLKKSATVAQLSKSLERKREDVERELENLKKDKLVTAIRGTYKVV